MYRPQRITKVGYQCIDHRRITQVSYQRIDHRHISKVDYQCIDHRRITKVGYQRIDHRHISKVGYECIYYLPTYYTLDHLYVLEKQANNAQTTYVLQKQAIYAQITYVLQKQATYVIQKTKNHKLTNGNFQFPGKITTVTYLPQNEAKMNIVIKDDTYHNTRRRRK